MAISKGLRRWLSGALMVAMLFMQLATAAYACPQLQQRKNMPDCQGMAAMADPAQPQLCKAHCTQAAQASAAHALPDLQCNPAGLLLVQPLPAAPAPGLQLLQRAAPPASHPGDPPLYLALLILRN
ncbi:hypothetical protein PFX98_12010 [Paucibacter sediminis]|uniref:Uncharacterized protein n=1 Tax=Paucibacter sediminis TaxID=3019553 RepID=A0AA95NFE9_9BURK|nr:hypothetical protein [Paucibacter sp. S2-9]WIT14310.1 hypothetical protein PFX98_12010 [Paucibacter sp. S2-9]